MPSTIGEVPNPHIRDFQRKRVYEAEEQCVFWNKLDILSLDKIDNLVNRIAKSFGINPPSIYLGDKKSPLIAYATTTKLVLPFPIAKSVPFICHEMSHVINYQLGPADHHGPHFAKAYLEVIKQFMGNPEFVELRQAFDVKHVNYKEVILV